MLVILTQFKILAATSLEATRGLSSWEIVKKPSLDPITSLTVKENHIPYQFTAVSEILGFRQKKLTTASNRIANILDDSQ